MLRTVKRDTETGLGGIAGRDWEPGSRVRIGEPMGMHMAKRMRERMLEKLNEAMVPLRAVRKSACVDGGWLWAMRLAVGTPV